LAGELDTELIDRMLQQPPEIKLSAPLQNVAAVTAALAALMQASPDGAGTRSSAEQSRPPSAASSWKLQGRQRLLHREPR